MPATDQILRDVLARLDALERRNDALEHDNAILKQQNAALLAGALPRRPAADDMHDEVSGTPLDRLSRRWVLRRGMQITAASVAAGALIRNENRAAHAHHSAQSVDVAAVYAHFVVAATAGEYPAVRGSTTTDNYAAIAGTNLAGGSGVDGSSFSGTGVTGNGLVGVYGTSSADGYGAVGGLHKGIGYGVVGDTAASGVSGVLGRNSLGDGVRGEGRNGVRGVSSWENNAAVYGQHTATGYGVIGDGLGSAPAGVMGRNATGDGLRGEGKIGVRGKATSTTGYGGLFEGGKAQLRIVPKTTAGAPTSGSHAKGEIYLDSAADLWVCRTGGSPGMWKKVTLS